MLTPTAFDRMMTSPPVHDVIDGYAPAQDLSLLEREDLKRMESAIRLAVAEVRRTSAPDLSAGVMAAIASASPGPARKISKSTLIRQLLRWFWTPHAITVPIRPAFIGAMATVVLLLPGLKADRGGIAGSAPDSAAPPAVYVQFRLEASGASRVALAGSFSRWDPAYELQETSPGIWSATLPLPPGVHDYAFLVDDRWVADPHALQVSDGFGGANNRIALPDLSAGAHQL